MTIDELKEYFTRYIPPFFGDCLIEIETTDDGHKVTVLDEEKGQLVNSKGEVTDPNYQSTIKVATLYTFDGKIGFIEHPYGAFTKANQVSAIRLLDLIGLELTVE